MRKLVLIIALIFISMMFKPTNSSSYDDCKILCPDIPWETHGTTIVPGIYGDFPACVFKAFWSYRYLDCPELSESWCDFKLDSVTCDGCPPSCMNNNAIYTITHSAIQEVIKDQIYQTPCFQGLENEGCTTMISMNYSGCWVREAGGPTNGYSKLIPCDETQCCRDVWKICKDYSGIMIDTLIATIGINPVCPSYECIAVCEELPKQESPLDVEDNFNSLFGVKALVYPNPTSSILSIHLITETIGVHIIEVYDIKGNLVLSEGFSMQYKEKYVQFNISKLSSGNYSFVIKQFDISIINGKFNIVN